MLRSINPCVDTYISIENPVANLKHCATIECQQIHVEFRIFTENIGSQRHFNLNILQVLFAHREFVRLFVADTNVIVIIIIWVKTTLAKRREREREGERKESKC